MLTEEQFDSLEVGDLIETSPLWEALSDDKVLLHTQARTANKLEFTATYMGINMGKWTANKSKKGVTWEIA